MGFRIALVFVVTQVCEPSPRPHEFRALPGHAASVLPQQEEFVSWLRQQQRDAPWFRRGPAAYCADLKNCSVGMRLAIHCADGPSECDFRTPDKSRCTFSEPQFLEALPSAIGELCYHDGDLCNATDSSSELEGASVRE